MHGNTMNLRLGDLMLSLVEQHLVILTAVEERYQQKKYYYQFLTGRFAGEYGADLEEYALIMRDAFIKQYGHLYGNANR